MMRGGGDVADDDAASAASSFFSSASASTTSSRRATHSGRYGRFSAAPEPLAGAAVDDIDGEEGPNSEDGRGSDRDGDDDPLLLLAIVVVVVVVVAETAAGENSGGAERAVSGRRIGSGTLAERADIPDDTMSLPSP
jgi:hypothetical protein